MLRQVLLSMAVAAALCSAQQPDNTEKNKRDSQGTTMTAEKQGNSKSDVDLLSRIRRAVTKDNSLSTSAHNVKIVVNDGQVWLRGPVANETERDQVVTIAKQLAGDNNVQNFLEVKGGK